MRCIQLNVIETVLTHIVFNNTVRHNVSGTNMMFNIVLSTLGLSLFTLYEIMWLGTNSFSSNEHPPVVDCNLATIFQLELSFYLKISAQNSIWWLSL